MENVVCLLQTITHDMKTRAVPFSRFGKTQKTCVSSTRPSVKMESLRVWKPADMKSFREMPLPKSYSAFVWAYGSPQTDKCLAHLDRK